MREDVDSLRIFQRLLEKDHLQKKNGEGALNRHLTRKADGVEIPCKLVDMPIFGNTLQGTNISHQKSHLKMIFLFPRWDMLIPWRVLLTVFFFVLPL